MARVLKRPMFRRGGSTNDGIMSGLTDREQYSNAGKVGQSARDYISQFEPIFREFTPKTRLPLGAVGAALVQGTPIKQALTAGYTDFTRRDDAREAAIRSGAVKLGLGQALKDATPSKSVLTNRKKAIVNIKASPNIELTEENILKETARLNRLDETGKGINQQRLIADREKEIRADGVPFEEAKKQANFEYILGPKIKAGLEAKNIEKTIQGKITFRDGEYQTKRKAPGIYFDPKRNNIVEITSELEVVINPPEILALL